MRSTLSLGGVALLLLAAGVACDEQPCDEYVDYMCACHDGEDGVDCAELRRLYADAAPEVQDACVDDLADQEDLDAANGEECLGDTGL